MSTEQVQPKTHRGPLCVGIGAVVGPVIAFMVTAALFPGTSYERALTWILGAIPFGAFVGWLVSLRKRPR
jgi:hypothetical protein